MYQTAALLSFSLLTLLADAVDAVGRAAILMLSWNGRHCSNLHLLSCWFVGTTSRIGVAAIPATVLNALNNDIA